MARDQSADSPGSYSTRAAFAVPFLSSAQDTPAPPKGLDERINEWFQPITDAWSSFVFYTINLGGVQVPLVVNMPVFLLA